MRSFFFAFLFLGGFLSFALSGAEFKPVEEKFQGEIVRIGTGECREVGSKCLDEVFLVVKMEDGQEMVWHIGPKTVVSEMIRALTVGQRITGLVFKTMNLAPGHYLVRQIITKDQDIEFRNHDLQPFWAL